MMRIWHYIYKCIAIRRPMKLIHLKQQHSSPFDTRDLKKLTTQCQFQIAHYLKNNPDYPVVLESLDADDGKPTDLDPKEIDKVLFNIKSEFNAKLPETFEALTRKQQDYLYQLGGARIAFALGHIKHIYKSIDDPRISDQATREKQAIDNCKRAIQQHYGKKGKKKGTALLIFGAKHDFSKHPEGKDLNIETKDFSLVSQQFIFQQVFTSPGSIDKQSTKQDKPGKSAASSQSKQPSLTQNQSSLFNASSKQNKDLSQQCRKDSFKNK